LEKKNNSASDQRGKHPRLIAKEIKCEQLEWIDKNSIKKLESEQNCNKGLREDFLS
jgi:hypothetical protein